MVVVGEETDSDSTEKQITCEQNFSHADTVEGERRDSLLELQRWYSSP